VVFGLILEKWWLVFGKKENVGEVKQNFLPNIMTGADLRQRNLHFHHIPF
jgi:hypothetical protein